MNPLKFSTRLNSFHTEKNQYWKDANQKVTTLDLIERMAQVEGLTHVELNYPQHFQDASKEEIQAKVNALGLKISGIALRYDNAFYKGEFTNSDQAIRERGIRITKEAVALCEELGGEVTTIWMANDGSDYAFQLDYQHAWKLEVEAIREVALAYPQSKISIEYKPYQPRVYTLFSDIGTTLLGIEDINCDNVGITLDFCHMLMKRENPSLSLSLAAQRNKLMGVHLNDGYKDNDDGLMLGSVHFMQTIEFIYYLKKYNYNGLIYFDTFPIRENPVEECETNIQMYKAISAFIDFVGMSHIEKIIEGKNAVLSQNILLEWMNYKLSAEQSIKTS